MRRPAQAAALRSALALLLGLAAGAAPALIYLRTTDAEMVSRAPVIVYGEVLAARPALGHGGRFPATDYEVEVVEALKGSPGGGRLVVRQPGGVRPDGRIGQMMGLPMLAVGDRALLFLERDGDTHRVVDHGLGIFFETALDTGRGSETVLMRDVSMRTRTIQPSRVGGPAFRASREQRPRDAGRFRRWIGDRAAGRDRPADYFAAAAAQGSVSRHYRVYRTGPSRDWCPSGFANVRWLEFDRGETIEFVPSNIAAAGPAVEALGAAMDAWNREPGSRVRLAIGPTTDTPLPFTESYGERDFVNAVTFEDPLDEIEGSLLKDARVLGGAIAMWSCRLLETVRKDGEIVGYWWHDIEPQPIPGRPETRAYPIFEANILINDGFWAWAQDLGRETGHPPSRFYEELLTHELGHALGIDHPCGSFIDCDPVTDQAIMRALAHEDGRGAALNADDVAAIRSLYPRQATDADGAFVPDCLPEETALCLGGGRYRVSARWAVGDEEAIARTVALSDDTGYLWFFDDTNVEVIVKVLDGCAINGHRWVFASGLTDVKVDLFVMDVATGRTRAWASPGGPFEPVVDTAAFTCLEGDG